MRPPRIVILAGGYGTRLRPLTYTRPKPMLPLAGKPVLQHIIEALARQGFDELIVTANYLCESIERYFGDGSRFGVELVYRRENTPLGTAGSVKNSENYLDDTFGVIQSDNITDLDLRALLKFHRSKKGLATLSVLPVDNPQEFGIAELDKDDRVVRFLEKPKPEECFSNLANTGLYVLEPEILDYIPRDSPFDFSKDLFPKLLSLERGVYGLRAGGFWADIGRFENFMKANKWILGRMESKKLVSIKTRARIRGPVHIGGGVAIEDGAVIVGPVVIEDGCKIGGGSTVKSCSVLGSNVKVGEGNQISGSILYENTLIGSSSRIDDCIIGENCRIGSGSIIHGDVVVGPNCSIGDLVRIQPGSRIWPNIEIEPGSVIRGIIRSYRE